MTSRHFKYIVALCFGVFLFATGPLVCQGQQQQLSESELVKAKSVYIDGITAFENENYRQALSLLKEAYVKLSDQAGINFALSDTFFELGDLTNAEHYGARAVDLDPDNLWYRLQLADIYNRNGKTKQAIAVLKTAREHHPKNSELLYKLAGMFEERGKLREANQIYGQLLFLEGENTRLRMQRLRNYSQRNMADSALAELDKIREQNPSNLSVINAIAEQYLQMDNVQEAENVLTDAKEQYGNNDQTAILLSKIYLEQQNWQQARTLSSNFASNPEISENEKARFARFILSVFETHRKNATLKDITATTFQTLLESNPESSSIHEYAADFFVMTEKFEQALESLKRINELSPSDDSAWKTRLELLLRRGEIKKAIEVGEQASEQIPQDPHILYFLGNAYLANKNYEKAVSNLEKAIRLPVRPKLKNGIHSSLGDSYALLENWEKAFENYASALEINSNNARVLNNYAYYLAKQDQNLQKAEKMAEKALHMEPQNPSYHDTFGLIRFKQEAFKEAEKHFRKAVELGGDSAEIMEHLGNTLFELGNIEEARTWWKRALKKDSSRTHLKEKISS